MLMTAIQNVNIAMLSNPCQKSVVVEIHIHTWHIRIDFVIISERNWDLFLNSNYDLVVLAFNLYLTLIKNKQEKKLNSERLIKDLFCISMKAMLMTPNRAQIFACNSESHHQMSTVYSAHCMQYTLVDIDFICVLVNQANILHSHSWWKHSLSLQLLYNMHR